MPVRSALGAHDDARFALGFTDTCIVRATSHLDLLASGTVYARLREWLTD